MDSHQEPIAELYAVWDGRFQPFHVGHLAVIRAIVEQFDEPLAVMIIQSSVDPVAQGHAATANAHHDPARNPLSLWERHHIVTTALAAEDLTDRVTVLGIPRPDLHWPIARSFYPSRRFMCLTGKDDYERAKATFWEALGESWRLVDCTGLPPVSGTAVKEAIKRGDAWHDLIPASVLPYFKSIDGPGRFAAANV